MNDLVYLKKDDVFTTSLVIAEGAGIPHKLIKRSIRKHENELLKFGKLSGTYVTKSSGGRPTEYYVLNEAQATFLITLLKNTPQVVEFKAELVSQFYKMRQFILERHTADWQETRKYGKITRKAETDMIQKLVEYAKGQGSTHSEWLYKNYTNIANKMAGITDRDKATTMQLNNLSLAENIILHVIDTGIIANKHYKEIFQDCKKRLETVKDIAYIGG